MTSGQVMVADGAGAAVAQSQLDQAALDKRLEALKALDFTGAVVNIYLLEVNIKNKNKRFVNVKRLRVEGSDKETFKGYSVDCIKGNDYICEHKAINTNQDNRFFYVEGAATDFSQIEGLLVKGNIDYVKDVSELNKFNSYVVQISYGDMTESIFAFTYIGSVWSLSKSAGKFLSFSNHDNQLIVKVDNSPRFQLTPSITFIKHKDGIFIADIGKFEIAMNYREVLQEKKVQAITAFATSSVISLVAKDVLSKVIGDDKHLMRQLASAHEKGYYTNDIWLTKLKAAAEDAGNWKIQFDDNGQIIILEDKDYVKELLILLQNKRVKTVVDGLVYDVDGELVALSAP